MEGTPVVHDTPSALWSGSRSIGRCDQGRRFAAGRHAAGHPAERICCPSDHMPRKKLEPVDPQTARTIGALLRDLRRTAGYRAVHDAAAHSDCPAAQQTIYAYERGGLVPSLKQFMDLVEFYALKSEGGQEVRYQ